MSVALDAQPVVGARGSEAHYPHYGGRAGKDVNRMEPAFGRYAAQAMRGRSRSPRTVLPMSSATTFRLYPDSLIVTAVRFTPLVSCALLKGGSFGFDCAPWRVAQSSKASPPHLVKDGPSRCWTGWLRKENARGLGGREGLIDHGTGTFDEKRRDGLGFWCVSLAHPHSVQ